MKKIHIAFLIILFSLFTYNNFSQVYMMGVAPLEPGNSWKYVDIGSFGGQSNFFVSDSRVTIGNYSYNIVEVFKDANSVRNQHFMGMSDDGYYIKYFTYAEDSIYKYNKKNSQIGDSWVQILTGYFTFYYSVIDTFTLNAWGNAMLAKVIKITDDSKLVEVYQVWTDSIGLMEENSIGQYDMILSGCVINGIVYGDTTTVGVADDFELPKSHILLQNYPNPFNPITKITFYIPFGSEVSLKVYDLFGQEVKILVNEYRAAGSYTELFDGKGLSSGVYIYVIKAGMFTETKKMILLK